MTNVPIHPNDFLTRFAAEPAVAHATDAGLAQVLNRLREHSPQVRAQVRRLETLTRQAVLDKALQGR